MNIKNIFFALVMITFVFTGCKQEAKKEISSDVKNVLASNTENVAINISGMTCEIGCAKIIQSKLSKQEGVLDAKVVFTDSIATVKYDPTKTNKASLIAFVGGIANNMYTATEATSEKSCSGKKSCDSNCKKECCKNKQGKTCSGDKKACEGKDGMACKKECCKNKEGKTCSGDKKTCKGEEGKACKDKDGMSCKKECCANKKA